MKRKLFNQNEDQNLSYKKKKKRFLIPTQRTLIKK